jgi:pyruvate formate lyase activating enzyme
VADRPLRGWIWDIQRYALHDGPGIRSLVFLKGCPLRCRWCCNPESHQRRPEIAWVAANCLGCDLCLAVCPAGAVQVVDGKRRIDSQRCDLCGRCVARCPGGALTQLGHETTVEAVLAEVTRDSIFYQRTGGGLTLSGGEPTAQPAFARELLSRYKLEEYGPHAAIETCGYAPWEDLAAVLEYSDLVLYDLKIMDPKRHRQATGVDNARILANAVRVAGAGPRLVIRLPLIPGYTDDEANVQAVARFAREVLEVGEIHLLPYHRLGETKYARLGRPYPLHGTAPLPEARLLALSHLVEELGLRAVIGG